MSGWGLTGKDQEGTFWSDEHSLSYMNGYLTAWKCTLKSCAFY